MKISNPFKDLFSSTADEELDPHSEQHNAEIQQVKQKQREIELRLRWIQVEVDTLSRRQED